MRKWVFKVQGVLEAAGIKMKGDLWGDDFYLKGTSVTGRKLPGFFWSAGWGAVKHNTKYRKYYRYVVCVVFLFVSCAVRSVPGSVQGMEECVCAEDEVCEVCWPCSCASDEFCSLCEDEMPEWFHSDHEDEEVEDIGELEWEEMNPE